MALTCSRRRDIAGEALSRAGGGVDIGGNACGRIRIDVGNGDPRTLRGKCASDRRASP